VRAEWPSVARRPRRSLWIAFSSSVGLTRSYEERKDVSIMSPFHDLGRRCGGLLPDESALTVPSSGFTLAAGGRTGANTDLHVISLPRLARLLSLGVLGLVALLSLGVGGVVLVQGHVLRESGVGNRELMSPSRYAETSSSRRNARRGSDASARATAGGFSADVLGNRARRQRLAAQSNPTFRPPGSISENEPETMPETVHVESATAP
jgi:hypothetical protein